MSVSMFKPDSSGGGGGGGGSLQWFEQDISPLPSIDTAGNRIFGYQNAGGQSLGASIKVPQGFNAGSPIKLYLPFYSPDSSGTALLQTVATLVRPGTTVFSATTNQR